MGSTPDGRPGGDLLHTTRSALTIVPPHFVQRRTGPVPTAPRRPRHPFSPLRRLLPFGLDEFFDVPLERRSHRRRPSEFFVQMIPAFGATGNMLFDSEHLSLGEFLQGVALHHHD